MSCLTKRLWPTDTTRGGGHSLTALASVGHRGRPWRSWTSGRAWTAWATGGWNDFVFRLFNLVKHQTVRRWQLFPFFYRATQEGRDSTTQGQEDPPYGFHFTAHKNSSIFFFPDLRPEGTVFSPGGQRRKGEKGTKGAQRGLWCQRRTWGWRTHRRHGKTVWLSEEQVWLKFSQKTVVLLNVSAGMRWPRTLYHRLTESKLMGMKMTVIEWWEDGDLLFCLNYLRNSADTKSSAAALDRLHCRTAAAAAAKTHSHVRFPIYFQQHPLFGCQLNKENLSSFLPGLQSKSRERFNFAAVHICLPLSFGF